MSKYKREYIDENDVTRVIFVKRPDNDSIKEADIHRAKIWNKAFLKLWEQSSQTPKHSRHDNCRIYVYWV